MIQAERPGGRGIVWQTGMDWAQMTDLRQVLAGIALGSAVLAFLPAQWASAQSAPPQEQATARPAFEKTLTSGAVQAHLLAVSPERPLPAGGSAFTQITISANAEGRRGVDAELLLEAERGRIANITGAGSEPAERREGQPARVRIEGLRKERERSVLVEVKLPQEDGAPAKLKVTLLADEKAQSEQGGETTADIAWSVRDCDGGYLAALRQIKEDDALRPSERWKEALKPDNSLPKQWLFAPATERRSRSRRRADPDVTASSPVKNERAIFTEAGKFVRAGRDAALDRKGNLGWVLGKVSQDLDTYLSQPANPAICTGAMKLADYYSSRLSGLKSRGERLAELARDAKALAKSRMEAAFGAARELAETAPGWGSVTPVAAKSMVLRADSLTAMAASLAELAGLAPGVLAQVREAGTPYAALTAVEEAGLDADGMPDEIRKALRSAFSALDASARLDAIASRHAGVQRAFEGRIQAIRDAHAKHCVCAS